MNPSSALRRRLHWLNLPTVSLVALLQRMPVVPIATAVEELVISSPVGTVLRSVATAAALGALHSRAGATTLTDNVDSPLQATVGTPIPPVAFGLDGTQTSPSSWQITGSLPPGLNIDGRTNLGLFNTSNPLLSGIPTTAGSYTLFLTGSDQGFISPSFPYTINVSGGTVSSAPSFTTQPASQTVNSGTNVTFTTAASGTPAPTFQWQKNGTAIGGATGASFTINNVALTDAATYTVVATNSAGSVASTGAVLTVNPAGVPPTITVQPLSQTVAPGGLATFPVTATGTNPTYQWFKNGTAIAGATTSTLILPSLQASDAADYTVVVTAAGSSVTSRFARLVVAVPDVGRIVNLSVRAPAGLGGQPLIVGYVVSGGSKSLLIRASGPALAQFGVTGTLPDPTLSVHQTVNSQDTILATNDNWGGTPALSAAFASVGAFPLTDPASKDAALLLNVNGASSALVSDTQNGSGVTLVEVYDAGTGNSPRLVNVSTRNFAGTGANVLIEGFVVSGNAPKTLLIRGVGPGLTGFGVTGVLADPFLEVHTTINGQDVIVASNDNWGDGGGAAALSTAFAGVGAFPLADPASKDAALLLTLPAGNYTAVVYGVNQTSGNALVEIYDTQ